MLREFDLVLLFRSSCTVKRMLCCEWQGEQARAASSDNGARKRSPNTCAVARSLDEDTTRLASYSGIVKSVCWCSWTTHDRVCVHDRYECVCRTWDGVPPVSHDGVSV